MPEYHVFVLLSEYEGLPVALLEAMSSGLVPVCTRVRSGITEVVRDGVNGLFVTDRKRAFVDAIRRLRSEKDLWITLSRSAVTTSLDFSLESTVSRWLGLIDDLMANPDGQRRLLSEDDFKPPSFYPEFRHDYTPKPLWRRTARRIKRMISMLR
jgi:hypothetical protein